MQTKENERNALVEESVLFRIAQLQKWLLQFADSTNAYRLVQEFGKDSRVEPGSYQPRALADPDVPN
jgi:hypothetical protein